MSTNDIAGVRDEPARARQRFDDLRRIIAGKVYTADDPEWDDVRRPWARAVDQTPLAVVEVADAQDVGMAVRWAVDNDRPVTAQPVGHGASGSLDQVLLLRTRALNSIKIDLPSRTATIGAGVKAGELLRALKDTGLTFLMGSNPDPTVVAMAITGGVSWFGRAHGLAANAIESIELVDGLGRTRHVSRTSDADLFWALRGGGGDFGIIVSLRIRLFPEPELYGGQLLWPLEQTPVVLRAFRELTRTAPDRLTAWFHRYHFPPLPHLPQELRGRSFAAIAVTYLGPQHEAEQLIEPLRGIPVPALGRLGPVPMDELASIAEEPVDPMPTMQHSMLVRELTDATIDALDARIGEGSDPAVTLVKVLHLGGALRTAHDGEGACGHIDEPYLVFAMGVLTGPDSRDAITRGFVGLDSALSAWTDGRTLPNFMGADGDVDLIWPPAVRDRLAEIKRRIDPMNTIRGNRAVLPNHH